ncbi:MAG: MBL fold metallo-hydrolase [Actinomycetota bacterium]|nr:MBL fold metallo-hydrolase [Actinomycetota bacterium]
MGDEYTGRVTPGSGGAERRDGRLLVRKRSVGNRDNNVYVVADAESGEAYVIDAAAEADRIRDAIGDLQPLAVLQTHGHWDHVRAWDDLVEELGLPVWGHRDDEDLFPRPLDRRLEDGERLSFGELELEVIHTPGHTPGGLQFLVEGDERPHLFTGDSLFPGGPGNTFGDESRFRQLMDGLKEKIFDRLPDETWVYPGHGNDTVLGEERPKIPEWEERGW